MCHMLADNIDELHAMADRIGVSRKWFQKNNVPHYDICMSKRKLAVKYGAIDIEKGKVLELVRKYRAEAQP